MSSGKWRPFCLGLNVLINFWKWKSLYFDSDLMEVRRNGLIDNTSALLYVMACRQIGDMPSPEIMLTTLYDALWFH